MTGRTKLFEDSLGDVKAKVVSWRRVPEIFGAVPGGFRMFSGNIEPKDIVQGAVGNCWFLASLGALAEYPEIIKKLFRSPRGANDEPIISPTGHYQIRFFDIETSSYVLIDIDDRIPCGADGKPVFARSNGPEAWVMLLEKAMAKYCGAYKEMSGGWSAWALRTLTGYACAGFNNWKGFWTPVRPVTKAKATRFGRVYRERKLFLDPKDKYEEWTLINRLVNWVNDDDHEYVFSAGTKGAGDDKQMVKGLYKSHAYSILAIVPVAEDFTLIQLRNPHGKGEWTGDWCDGDKRWKFNKKAVNLCAKATTISRGSNDGAFWMHFETDFVQHFARVDVVRFAKKGKDANEDGKEDDDEYGSSDEPFDEYGDLDLEDVLPAKSEQEIRDHFDRVDQDHDGYVSRLELREYLKQLDDVRLTPEVISRLLDEVDIIKNNEGISFKEFRGVYGIETGPSKLEPGPSVNL